MEARFFLGVLSLVALYGVANGKLNGYFLKLLSAGCFRPVTHAGLVHSIMVHMFLNEGFQKVNMY